MKGSVVKPLFCKRSHTGKALYLLSDLILIHAELGHGNMVEKPTSAASQLNFPTPFCVFFTKKEEYFLSCCFKVYPKKAKRGV